MKDNSERVVHFEVVVESILFADLRIVQRQKEKRKKKIKQNKKKKMTNCLQILSFSGPQWGTALRTSESAWER